MRRRGESGRKDSDSEPRSIPNLLEGYGMAKRRKFTDRIKVSVVLATLPADNTIPEVAARHQAHPNRVIT